MKILYIHNEQRVRYGAHFINDLISKKLRSAGHTVDHIYPEEPINLFSRSLRGISNILFFYSLTKHRERAAQYDIIQGTTYTPLAFLNNGTTPVVTHFGSTTQGFLKNVPTLARLEQENPELLSIFNELREKSVVDELHAPLRSIKDIAKIELYTAKQSDLVIATSRGVKQELIKGGVPAEKIAVIHNMIEDYWFRPVLRPKPKAIAQLVYLGRLGDDGFTVKLKGINRLMYILRKYPDLKKEVIGMAQKTEAYQTLFGSIPNTTAHLSVRKRKIPPLLRAHYGDIYINTGRYEGFCLSLIEAMSQGLVPIIFPIGVAPEIIQNGKNGYVVHSLSAMQRKISLLAKDRAKRGRMAAEAMETAKQFSSRIITQEYLTAYDNLHNSLRKTAPQVTALAPVSANQPVPR